MTTVGRASRNSSPSCRRITIGGGSVLCPSPLWIPGGGERIGCFAFRCSRVPSRASLRFRFGTAFGAPSARSPGLNKAQNYRIGVHPRQPRPCACRDYQFCPNQLLRASERLFHVPNALSDTSDSVEDFFRSGQLLDDI